jgi:hypothetical protein
MTDRSFSETDLRRMLEDASRCRSDLETGRFVVETSLMGRAWEVIVEPDVVAELLVVVTAYPVV